MSRHRFDPLAVRDQPHWLTISDMHRNLIKCESIAPGTDLHETLRAAIARWAADKWQAESDGAWGFCFATRGNERRFLSITPVDPTVPGDGGHAFLAGQGVVIQPAR